MSSYGVMRGLHFQRPPFTQSKQVRCVKGRVIIIPSFKRAALGNLKASFHCTHWHRFFPLKTYPSFLTVKEGSTFLTKPLFPQGREDVTALLGARNRFALRLTGHQSPRHVLRDGTAWGCPATIR